MFFPADLLANTEEIKANKTKADILEHNTVRGSYIAEINATYFYRIICRRGKLIACTQMAVEFNDCKANLMFLSEY